MTGARLDGGATGGATASAELGLLTRADGADGTGPAGRDRREWA